MRRCAVGESKESNPRKGPHEVSAKTQPAAGSCIPYGRSTKAKRDEDGPQGAGKREELSKDKRCAEPLRERTGWPQSEDNARAPCHQEKRGNNDGGQRPPTRREGAGMGHHVRDNTPVG